MLEAFLTSTVLVAIAEIGDNGHAPVAAQANLRSKLSA